MGDVFKQITKNRTESERHRYKPTQPARPKTIFAYNIHSLQATAGNRVIQRLMETGVFQAKLRIGQPMNRLYQAGIIQAALKIKRSNDRSEQEADHMASQVMKMSEGTQQQPEKEEREPILPKPIARQITPLVQRQEGAEEVEDVQTVVQRKSDNGGNGLARDIQSIKSGGQPLSRSVRSFFEPRFDKDFSQVRIHTGSQAERAARLINAQAFTIGRNVVFGSGQYSPGTSAGKQLIAHELTHVVQQRGGASGIASYIQRRLEVHVNLRNRGQRVKLYQNSTAQQFVASAGPNTRSLIRRRHHSIIAKVGPPPRKTYNWGLQYFAQVTRGGIGFHSNIAFPFRRTLCRDGIRRYCSGNRSQRVRYPLIVDGTPRSHGCIRLNHGNSQTLFNAVTVGTRVYFYARRNWRPPSWSSSPNRALP